MKCESIKIPEPITFVSGGSDFVGAVVNMVKIDGANAAETGVVLRKQGPAQRC